MSEPSVDTFEPSIFWRIFRNPIVRRELAVGGRSLKILISLIISVVIQAAVMGIMLYANLDQYGGYSEAGNVGQWLLIAEMICLLVITVVIFPALSATAIASERSNGSLDLLRLTPLATWELIWGKIVVSMAHSLMFVLSAIPFVMLAHSFPDTPLRTAILVLVWIFVLASLITAMGIYASVVFKRPMASMIASYVGAIILGFFSMIIISAVIADMQLSTGIIDRILGSMPEAARDFVVVAVVGGTFMYFVMFFLMTVARMKDTTDNTSTALRIYSVIATVIYLGMLIAAYYAFDVESYLGAIATAFTLLVTVTFSLTIAAVKAAGMSAFGPRQVRRNFKERVAKNPSARFFWIFMPGSLSGWLLGMILSFLVLGGTAYFGTAMMSNAMNHTTGSDAAAREFVANEISSTNYALRTYNQNDRVSILSGEDFATLISTQSKLDPKLDAAVLETKDRLIAADQKPVWFIFWLGMATIGAFGALAWYFSLKTRKRSLGAILAGAALLVVMILPAALGLAAETLNPRLAKTVYQLSPFASFRVYVEYSDHARLESFYDLSVDGGLPSAYQDYFKKEADRFEEEIRHNNSYFVVMALIFLFALFAGRKAHAKCLKEIEAANGRWPPPRLPAPRDFTASGQTGLAIDGSVIAADPGMVNAPPLPPSAQSPVAPPLPSATPPSRMPPSLPPSMPGLPPSSGGDGDFDL